MAQQQRLPRLFPEQELTFTCPLGPNLLVLVLILAIRLLLLMEDSVIFSESIEAACRAPQISPGSEAEMQSIFRSCITERQVGRDFQCRDNHTQSRHKRHQTGSGRKYHSKYFWNLVVC